MKLSKISLALLLIQLAIVSSIAAKYLYQRWTCPRVWARTVAFDPELPMRGRYLSLQLTVDGCRSTLPSARAAAFPRDINGVAIQGAFSIRNVPPVEFHADLKVQNNRLLAIRIEDDRNGTLGQRVSAWPGRSCNDMRLDAPVDFYIAEHAASPLPLKPSQELWIEVTLPRKGPPRPTQIALKDNGAWKPMAFQ